MSFLGSIGFSGTNQDTQSQSNTQSSSNRDLTVQDTTNRTLTDILNNLQQSLSQSGQTSQQSSNITTGRNVSEQALPFLQQLLQSGPQAFSQTPQFFPGSTVANPSATETQAQNALINRLFGGNDLQQASTAETLKILNGVHNPFISDTVQAAIRPVEQSFLNNVLPNLNANFIGSNRTGSGAADRATQIANSDFTRNIGDIASNIGFQSFQNERNRQQAAAQFAPTLAQNRTNELSQLFNIGRSKTADEQQKIDEAVKRFQFGQEAPRTDAERLTNVLNAINAQFGSQTQTGQQLGNVANMAQAQTTNQQIQTQVVDILRNILENEQKQAQSSTQSSQNIEQRKFNSTLGFK